MNAVEALPKERTETVKRVTALREQTKFEKLRKEVLEYKRELAKLSGPPIIEWIKRLFR